MKIVMLIFLCGMMLLLPACAEKSDSDINHPMQESTDNQQIPSESHSNREQITTELDAMLQNELVYDYATIEQLHKDKATVEQCEDVLKVAPSVTDEGIPYYIIQTELSPVLVQFGPNQTVELLCVLDFSNGIDKERIGQVTVGISIEDVHEIDPKGSYPFLYAGFSEVPMYSLHYVSGEGVYIFMYDESETVSSVDFLRQSHVCSL